MGAVAEAPVKVSYLAPPHRSAAMDRDKTPKRQHEIDFRRARSKEELKAHDNEMAVRPIREIYPIDSMGSCPWRIDKNQAAVGSQNSAYRAINHLRMCVGFLSVPVFLGRPCSITTRNIVTSIGDRLG